MRIFCIRNYRLFMTIKKIKNMKTLLFLTFCISLITSCTSSPLYIQLINREMDIFIGERKRDNNLILLGSGGALMHDVKLVDFHFMTCEKKMNIKYARRMIVETIESFLKQINANEDIRPFLHNFPFLVTNLEIIISCSDDHDIEPENFIVMVGTIKGKLRYFVKKHDGNYKKVHEEPYEEGLQIIKKENSCLSPLVNLPQIDNTFDSLKKAKNNQYETKYNYQIVNKKLSFIYDD
jgi:hypothetical protein